MDFFNKNLTRRDFLKSSALFASSCLLIPCITGLSSCGTSSTMPDYYQTHSEELLKNFQNQVDCAKPMLTQMYGAETAEEICREATGVFKSHYMKLPDIGGDNNPIIYCFPPALWFLSFYLPMKARGISAKDTGKLLYDVNLMIMEHIPPEEMKARGAAMFTPEGIQGAQQFCEWTQERQYPDNFVATFVPGDGANFDFGYDFTECACLKYLQQQGAEEIAPYVCMEDFAISDAEGSGLYREGTLAWGNPVCDFRYKKNRPVTQNWDTEIGKVPS